MSVVSLSGLLQFYLPAFLSFKKSDYTTNLKSSFLLSFCLFFMAFYFLVMNTKISENVTVEIFLKFSSVTGIVSVSSDFFCSRLCI